MLASGWRRLNLGRYEARGVKISRTQRAAERLVDETHANHRALRRNQSHPLADMNQVIDSQQKLCAVCTIRREAPDVITVLQRGTFIAPSRHS